MVSTLIIHAYLPGYGQRPPCLVPEYLRGYLPRYDQHSRVSALGYLSGYVLHQQVIYACIYPGMTSIPRCGTVNTLDTHGYFPGYNQYTGLVLGYLLGHEQCSQNCYPGIYPSMTNTAGIWHTEMYSGMRIEPGFGSRVSTRVHPTYPGLVRGYPRLFIPYLAVWFPSI